MGSEGVASDPSDFDTHTQETAKNVPSIFGCYLGKAAENWKRTYSILSSDFFETIVTVSLAKTFWICLGEAFIAYP